MKGNSILIALILCCVVLSCGKDNRSARAVRKDITQAVYASGKIFPKNDYRVLSKLPGYVQKIHVHVGDSVKIGDPLITIKSEVSDLNIESARNLFQLAKENASENSNFMTSLKQDVANAYEKYKMDSVNYIRFSNLLKENATSKVQADQAQTQFNVSRQLYTKALATLSTTREKLKVELENANIQLQAQQSNKNDYTLVSAVNGKVYDVICKEGELVNTGNVLLELGSGTNYEIELSVDETDVSLIKPGLVVVYAIDAYKEDVYKGLVTEIYPRINQTNKTSKVMSSISIPASLNVFSGMSVEANIVIAEKKNALLIPREYVVESNKVRLAGSDTLTPFVKGLEDLEYVEALGGLDESAEFIRP